MKKISKIIVYYDDGTFEECNMEKPYIPPFTGPIPGAPYQPIPVQNPWYPPNTITCKMPDGTTKEINLDGPITAYATNELGRNE